MSSKKSVLADNSEIDSVSENIKSVSVIENVTETSNEMRGALISAAGTALESIASASVAIPFVGLALKGLSMLCNQIGAFLALM
jgi:hypothetical protein